MEIHTTSHPILDLFAETLAVPSPSGHEEQLAQLIREKLEGLGYDHRTDATGNVIVPLAGVQADAHLCCIAAHMDEIGLVVTKIASDGSLHVDGSGGLYPCKLGEGPLDILGDNETIVGILSMGSAHTPALGDQPITWDKVRVLSGLTPEQLKVAGVRPGSTAVPQRERRGPVLFGDSNDPLVGAWTFDDRMGVVVLLQLLEVMKRSDINPRCPTLVAFTIHEEVGGYGAKVLAQREKPETFISIDGCPIPPGVPLKLDGRPGIWSKDRYIHYDQNLLGALSRAAVKAGTELQPVVYANNASDASLVYAVGGAERVACFGHVRENSHGYEVARLSAFDNVLKTLLQFIATWEG